MEAIARVLAFVFVGVVTMKIGIGIDTGGTCTDAVIYRFEDKKILAYGKASTTKNDLAIGIGNALDELPRDLISQAEVIALSTTLATNACVENKGGRAKLIFFGINPENVSRTGKEYGLSNMEQLIFVDSKTKPNGEIVKFPDWEDFQKNISTWLADCDAVGIVELFAQKTGAQLEKKAKELIQKELGIPVVCGYSLFAENNIIKRGASALLNARLIFVIEEFLEAVKKALEERNIDIPFVIVRSDGSLMNGEFTATRPVETLLCGPVASVMGAAELTSEENCIVVDIGGTTTDIAFVKNGVPQRVKNGVRIGKWDTFVKGLFVDTFGLGGDSGVLIDRDANVKLEEEKVMPLCMAADMHPSLLKVLKREYDSRSRLYSQQKNIYLKIKNIEKDSGYTKKECEIAELLSEPHSLEELKSLYGETVMDYHLQRLIREGILIRCGVTPTDVMHVKGDFVKYNVEAARYGIEILARVMRVTLEEMSEMIYEAFKKKLYSNIVRILIEDAYPKIRETGIGEQMESVIEDSYQRVKNGDDQPFLGLKFYTPATLVGVGAPTKVFIEDVGKMLGAKVVTSEYSSVANALGAVVGNVSANAKMEVLYQQESDTYMVYGYGKKEIFESKEEAKAVAKQWVAEVAIGEAVARGANRESLEVTIDNQENILETAFGNVFMGYVVTATVVGNLKLS